MTFLLLFSAAFVGWLAICAAVNAWTRPSAPAVTDPVAEFRAALPSAAVPPGGHR
ncbi:hypothetical protein [Streptomyces malaysiensis]|uniref:hypothetical protein n=1 Tax=Streptomyces malaysiensis TaxID=92644 RepID=UPI00165189B5|nr:hypothetical protein [Streptomyces malaysiensis]